jgi:multisubunit Na+/H+ antiporter MnhF subunit
MVAAAAALAILAAAGLVAVAAALRGPSTGDRMLAVDLLLVVLSAGLGVGAVLTGRTELLPVLLVVSLVAFVGTVVVGRTLEREDRR